MPRLLTRLAASPKAWVAMAILAPVGMLLISATMLLELRRDAWARSEQTSLNLLHVIERDISRNVEIIDLSLRSVADSLKSPSVTQAPPDLRQLILFNRMATAQDIGAMVVLDEKGDAVFEAGGFPPRKINNSDRDYFQAHKGDPHLGLDVSKPLVSKLTGDPVVVLSRRIDKPDGSFGGVVLASLRLAYFERLFDRIGLGSEGAINLYRNDGVRIMRYPHTAADIGASIAGSSNWELFTRQPSGAFTAHSIRDGVERHFVFTTIGEQRLVLNVAVATHDVEAAWRNRAVVIAATLLLLCALTAGLSLRFGFELRRRSRMQAELARLSNTDALTALTNRRHFDGELANAFEQARSTGKPLSLLLVDADHFKRVNDRHGHAVGDEVLKGLARALRASVHRPGDLASRVGGEEFGLILSDTDEAGASRVAEKIHAEVGRLTVEAPGADAVSVTVSIGLATFAWPDSRCRRKDDLYRFADEALYEAKGAGRNRTCRAATARLQSVAASRSA